MQVDEDAVRISRNVRFLLWKHPVEPGLWGEWLCSRARGLVSRTAATAFLREEDSPGPAQIGLLVEVLVSALAVDEETLRYTDLIEVRGVDVLAENLQFLLNSLGHGGKGLVAGAIGVDPTTISRWLSGSTRPHESTLRDLARFFGLPSGTDLRQNPVFLASQPITTPDRRRWLHRRLDRLSHDELRDLFPAFRRLLGDR